MKKQIYDEKNGLSYVSNKTLLGIKSPFDEMGGE